MKRMLPILITFAILAGLFSCKKKTEPDLVYPTILGISLSTTSVKQFEESVTLTISYKDGDGDLGAENPDSAVVFVQDSRLDKPDKYHIPPLAPLGSELSIQGKITITLNSTFLIGNGTAEDITYSVELKDRAGHRSNTFTTEKIRIHQ